MVFTYLATVVAIAHDVQICWHNHGMQFLNGHVLKSHKTMPAFYKAFTRVHLATICLQRVTQCKPTWCMVNKPAHVLILKNEHTLLFMPALEHTESQCTQYNVSAFIQQSGLSPLITWVLKARHVWVCESALSKACLIGSTCRG